jgi:outer membrane protein assembly factor BamB
LKRAAAGLFLVCMALAARAEDWPLSRYSASRNANSPEELPQKIKLAWALDLPRLTPGWIDQPRMQFDAVYQPIVVDGRMIVASPNDDSVTAYDLKSGKELWRFMTGGPVRLPPVADKGRIFAGSDDGYLYALDAEKGALIWKIKGAPKERLILGNGRMIDTWPVRGGPVVADGKVYFAAGIWPFMGVFVHCVDAESGKVIWTNSGDGAAFLTQPHGAKAFSGIAPQGSMALIGERLLIPNGRSEAASYERATGKMQYFAFANKFGGHDVVAAEKVFFCGGLAFELKDGKPIGSAVTSPVVSDTVVYGLGQNILQGYDLSQEVKNSGAVKFKTAPTPKYMQTVATPFAGGKVVIIAGKRLYVGGKGRVAAFDLPLKAGRDPAWEMPVDGTVMYLAASAGRLLAVSDEGSITCFGAVQSAVKPEVRAPDTTTTPGPLALPVKALLDDAHVDAGWAVVLGASGLDLAREMAVQSRLQILILDTDAAKIDAARRELLARGLYGERIALHAGAISTLPLPPYFASLIVNAAGEKLTLDDNGCAKLFRALHPYNGKAYLSLDAASSTALNTFAAAQDGHAAVAAYKEQSRLSRSGGLPGAANWTHEHADAGNTRVSKDALVKAPLGVLWFGGSSHDGILPRHGHGPQPQVVDGRLIIEGMDMLRAVDIYSGRVLWEASLPGIGSYYNNLNHHPGANGTGTNYISMPDGIYVAMDRSCVRLDPATGVKSGEFPLPPDAPKGMIWGYLNVIGDFVIGGVAQPVAGKDIAPEKKKKPEEEEEDDDTHADDHGQPAILLPRAVSSRSLFVLDRKTGKLLWSVKSDSEFRHNAVCAGNGKLFAIDRLSRPLSKIKLSDDDAVGGSLRAFDLANGKVAWRSDEQITGTWLSYSDEFDVLVESARTARDTLKDESKGMRGFRGRDGSLLWSDPKAAAPAMIRGATVLKEKTAGDLLNGQPVTYADPITGRAKEWTWTRQYGCNTPAAAQHLITFRSGAAGYYDLERNGGTGNFGGFRSSCTHNLLVAGGIITAPDYTRTCTCSYQLQTSVALVFDPDVEMWTYIGTSADVKEPIKHLGINLGAPGDRVDDSGTLWLEYPSTGGPSPKLEIKCDPDKPDVFCQHSSVITGAMPWVTASGMKKLHTLKLAMNSNSERPFTVRLFFSEPDSNAAGARVFDVLLQDNAVLKAFDIVSESGAPRTSLIKEFKGVMIGADFKLELKPATHAMVPLICGIELIAE